MKNYQFNSLDFLKKWVDPDQPLMFDTETIGLYGKIRLAQFYQRGWEDVLMVDYPDSFKLVSLITKCHLVMQNAAYDISTIQEGLGKVVWMPEKFDCTLLLSRLYFYDKEKFDLGSLIEYLGITKYYEGITQSKKELQRSDWSIETLTEDQLNYAAADVLALHDLWDKVKEVQDTNSYKLDMLTLRICLDFQLNGMQVDFTKLQARLIENLEKIDSYTVPVNVNSAKQVKEYLGIEDSKASTLAKLITEGNEKAKAIRRVRTLKKENTFINKYFTEHVDEKIMGKFSPTARSGRAICKNINLHQNPRRLKSVMGVKDGQVLIYADYSQLELRCIAIMAPDYTMIDLYKQGADIHTYTKESIPVLANLSQNKALVDSPNIDARYIAKTCNFNFLYGGGALIVQEIVLKDAEIFIPDEEVYAIKKDWLKTWAGIANWQQRGVQDWTKKRAWKTPLGRRYIGKRLPDHLNIQIQGYGAEVTKLAIHYLAPALKELDPRIKLSNWIHDAFLVRCPEEKDLYEAASKIVGDSMKRAWVEMLRFVLIKDMPMPIDVFVGFNWGDIEKGDFIYNYKIEGKI